MQKHPIHLGWRQLFHCEERVSELRDHPSVSGATNPSYNRVWVVVQRLQCGMYPPKDVGRYLICKFVARTLVPVLDDLCIVVEQIASAGTEPIPEPQTKTLALLLLLCLSAQELEKIVLHTLPLSATRLVHCMSIYSINEVLQKCGSSAGNPYI